MNTGSSFEVSLFSGTLGNNYSVIDSGSGLIALLKNGSLLNSTVLAYSFNSSHQYTLTIANNNGSFTITMLDKTASVSTSVNTTDSGLMTSFSAFQMDGGGFANPTSYSTTVSDISLVD
jgi:hypothetical protein